MQTNLIFTGHIETLYNKLEECPRNIDLNGPLCRLVLKEEYKEGIKGLKEEVYILILYCLNEADRNLITQQPFLPDSENEMNGIFSLRSPHRPNPIGAAVSKI